MQKGNAVRKYVMLLLAITVFAAVHESIHVFAAAAFGELKEFHVKPYGFEVEFKTPVSERAGVKWGIISGSSNFATIAMGYVMFLFRKRIANSRKTNLYIQGYWVTLCFLLLDPVNLSIGPFIYGGDVNGIAAGFGLNQYVIQAAFFGLLLLNRELVVQKLFTVYHIETKHPFFQPLLKHRQHANK